MEPNFVIASHKEAVATDFIALFMTGIRLIYRSLMPEGRLPNKTSFFLSLSVGSLTGL